MSREEHILQLLKKFDEGKTTVEELKELDDWYESFENLPVPLLSAERKDASLRNVHKRLTEVNEKRQFSRKNTIRKTAISLATIAALAIGFIFIRDKISKTNFENLTTSNDVVAGGNSATLTLANGTKIDLGDQPNGALSKTGAIKIVKINDGLLQYEGNLGSDKVVEWNTVSTPIGGQYQLILSDGTKVWLNAQSSIKFPSKFDGKKRIVTTTGEAYFDIETQRKGSTRIPFIVQTGDQEIEVLGTEFNVNAYADDFSYHTTLVEGSIKLKSKSNKTSSLLKPNQAAKYSINSKEIKVSAADMSAAIAWKNGYFEFNETKLQTLMKALERWYPIETVYAGKISTELFYGKIDRKYSLSEVLKILQLNNLNFKIESKAGANGKRKLMILP